MPRCCFTTQRVVRSPPSVVNSGISRPSLYKCIDRALAAGVEVALKDKYHRPRAPVISAEAKAWVLHLACSKPTEHGYAAEVWSLSALAQHARQHGAS